MNHQKQNHLVKILKALANANRIKILQAIANSKEKRLTVNQIAEKVGMKQANVSGHLKLMRLSKAVSAKQESSFMHYSINDPIVESTIAFLK